MQYKPSSRYSQLHRRLIRRISLTREEVEEFMQLTVEEDARQERFVVFMRDFHEHQAHELDAQRARLEALMRSLSETTVGEMDHGQLEVEDGESC